MTTIATDGITVAADGQSLAGWQIVSKNTKKIVVEKNTIFALSGLTGMREPLVKWYFDGADANKLPPCTPGDDGWSLLVINKDGVFVFTHRVPYPMPLPSVQAIGAGQDYALAAMTMGADARRAVEVAMEHSACSGGEIQVVNIAEALGLQPTLKLVAGE